MLWFAREIVKKLLLSRAGAEGCFIVKVSHESWRALTRRVAGREGECRPSQAHGLGFCLSLTCMFIPFFLLEFWKLLEGGDCVPYVVFPISLTFCNTYLSFSCSWRIFFWLLRKGDARFCISGKQTVRGIFGTQIKVVRLVLGLNKPRIPETVADRWCLAPDNSPSGLPPQLKGEDRQAHWSLIVPSHRCSEATQREDLPHYGSFQEAADQVISSLRIRSVDLAVGAWTQADFTKPMTRGLISLTKAPSLVCFRKGGDEMGKR